MSTGQLVLAMLGSAAVGALISSIISITAQWRERVGRQRELIFASAIDLSKAWVGRMSAKNESYARVSEVMVVERMHLILQQIFNSGRMSEANKEFLESTLKKADDPERKD
jgi:hypothetical protein